VSAKSDVPKVNKSVDARPTEKRLTVVLLLRLDLSI
jgi:hypothetical protein